MQGKPFTDPAKLPPQFQNFSDEAKMAAMDAYNGALEQGLPEGEALAMAQQAAKNVDGMESQGISDETLNPSGPNPRPSEVAGPPAGGGMPAGGGASLAQALAGQPRA